jgi:hypothetical protein
MYEREIAAALHELRVPAAIVHGTAPVSFHRSVHDRGAGVKKKFTKSGRKRGFDC